ncbi:MAG: class I SAM-dependent methyltransferase [Acidobacteriota bacterium]|nr:class I SAM-dependent methyltransferase [Acidobacteriota bacterium]
MSNIFMDEIIRNLANDDAVRLFHGRGHCFPGWEDINAEYYPPVLVVQCFGDEDGASIPPLLPQLKAVFHKTPLEAVVLQRRQGREVTWQVLDGEVPETVFAVEAGLRFEVELMRKQNIGFFPDMRLGRKLVRDLAAGARVLNLFAYTCSLSAAAMAGGAETVVNMDVSKAALRVGRRNHLHNALDVRSVQFLSFDIMRSFGRLNKSGPFDLVILDPPTRQKNRFDAVTDYPRIIRRLPEFLAPGASVIACLNAPHLGFDKLEGMFDPDRFTLISRLGRPPECPEKEPDRALKICRFQFKTGGG